MWGVPGSSRRLMDIYRLKLDTPHNSKFLSIKRKYTLASPKPSNMPFIQFIRFVAMISSLQDIDLVVASRCYSQSDFSGHN